MKNNISIRLDVFLIAIFILCLRAAAQIATVDATNIKQYIDGFGASTAWHGQLSEKEADAAFGNANDTQMGLSILRIRIDPNGSYTDELRNAQKATARGAIVFASPWSPPARMKTNNNTVGGQLKSTSYADYANYLNSFADYMSKYGAPLYAISLQNEPDIQVNYESCDWSPSQMVKFLKEQGSSITTKVIAPESFQFRRTMSDPILKDSLACEHVDIIGGHIYGGGLAAYPLAAEKGKSVWMTEHYINEDDITTCINKFAKEIIDCMYKDMNAFVWWYLRQPDCNLIHSGGKFKKKGYVMAHFSKFIRPGYHRIEATYRPQSGVYLVAFKGEETVIVVINTSLSKEQTFSFSNDSITHVKRYTTSESKNLSYDGIIDVVDNSFSATLDGRSISTFVSTSETASVNLSDSERPQSYSLLKNYPNPFNPTTKIEFSLPARANVSLKVYDVTGNHVATLVDGERSAGVHSVIFDAAQRSSGIYIYKLDTGREILTNKMMLVK